METLIVLIDRLRIFPRIVLVLYILTVSIVLDWYMDYEIKYETTCNSQVIQVLLDRGSEVKEAERVACSVTKAIGRPDGYTALVSVIFGVGTGIFGFYVNSGAEFNRKRRKEE